MEGDHLIVDSLLEALPGVLAIYRFGSAATGETHGGSDVDLAVLPSAPVDSIVRWDAQETLALSLRRPVDLVDLLAASTVMRMQVVKDGVILYDASPGKRRMFETMVFSSYARLNEERAAILRRVMEEGKAYG